MTAAEPATAPAAADPQAEGPARPTLAALLATVQELGSAADLKTGLERVAHEVRRSVDCDTLAILLLDERGRELQFEVAIGLPEGISEHWRFGMGQGLVGTAAETGEVVLVADVAADLRYINAGTRVRSEVAIPLVTRDRTVGVLDLGSNRPDAFTAEDVCLLETLAGQLAAAIESARMQRNMREQARTLSLLHEASRELGALLDRGELLEKTASLVERLIEFDVLNIMLWSADRQLLEPALTIFRDKSPVGTTMPVALGQGLCGTAAALRQAVRVPNVHLDARYVGCVRGLEIRSELVVPLIVKDRLIGVLDVESTHYDAFTSRHEQTLSTLGSSVAIALENARLYEQLQENEQRLQQDLSTAREIQNQLLPKATPWVPGLQVAVAYEPARHLGGDFYDFLNYGDGRAAFAVGDVAGKATSAALYGSLAVGMLREYTGQSRGEPALTLADLNAKLRQLGISNRFLALAFAVYDSRSRVLTLANSGLPHPLLIRAGEAQPVSVEGVPLGLLPDRSYREVSLELAPGDLVVFCTDGIEESLNAAEEELGVERVRRTVASLAAGSARAVADGLLDTVRRHCGGAEPSDDRTIVVLKATEA